MADRSLTLGAVSEVLRSVGLLRDMIGPEDVAVLGASQDSRNTRPGDVFLAWRGTTEDAHDFVADAVAAGAAAAVVEHRVNIAVPQLVVDDGRRAAALVADLLADSPWRALFTVAITGTNGKTTTSLLIRHLCDDRGPAVAIGTLGLVDERGVRPGTDGLTTPGPVQVSRWLEELADEGVETVVMEASSHALEQRRLDGVRFDVAVFTNLTQDHLDYHASLDEYLSAKARLVELVKDGGTLVVNRDDHAWDALPVGGRRVRTFAVDAQADVRAEEVTLGPGGSSFTLVADGLRARVELPLLGRYNVENALAAAAVALVAGLALDDVAAELRTVPQPTGRLEAVLRHPFTVLIDFAHTPHALEGVLGAVRPLTHGRLIVVFGAGGDRDRLKRRPMAEAVRRFADVVVLTSDNPRTEDPERILDDLAMGLEGLDYARIADRRSAIRHALEIAREGDTIVLAGKGHETYQVVGLEKRAFDERAVVRECLSELGVA